MVGSFAVKFYNVCRDWCKKNLTGSKFHYYLKIHIVFPILMNFLKMISSWVDKVAIISAWLDAICEFFTNIQFLSQPNFFCISLYIKRMISSSINNFCFWLNNVTRTTNSLYRLLALKQKTSNPFFQNQNPREKLNSTHIYLRFSYWIFYSFTTTKSFS